NEKLGKKQAVTASSNILSTPPLTPDSMSKDKIQKTVTVVPSSKKATVTRENVESRFRTVSLPTSKIFNQDEELRPKIVETIQKETIFKIPTPIVTSNEQRFDGDKYLARLETLHSIFMPDYPDLYEKLAKSPYDDNLLKNSFEERSKRKSYKQNKKKFDEILPYATAIKFVYQEDIGRFMLKINDNRIKYVTLSSQISYVLGYEDGKPIRNLDIARYSPDLRGGCSHICVYIGGGLLEQMIVGDKLASLLQIVAVSGKPGDIIEKKYDSPLFSKVIAREIQEIEVELRNLEGRLIPFDYGAVICTLIFRKTIVF
ncbi:MAG TPA: hypothetical protein VFV08_16640, partial [Puia sp.]|nr:hypothetical protein [Puia sp.]